MARFMLVLTLMATLLCGCANQSIRPATDPSAAAAYGNISLPHNRVITRVILYKVGEVYAPPFKSPPTSHTYQNGNFFFENLTPGKYFLMGFMSGRDAFYFNFRGIDKEKFIKKVAIDIKPGSVTYLGSYRVTGINRNWIRTGTFDIKPSRTPGPKKILGHLMKATSGTGWDRRFAKAMK